MHELRKYAIHQCRCGWNNRSRYTERVCIMTHDAAVLTFDPPPMSVSMPEALNWHMILDHELTALTKPETGVIGSLRFVGLGSVLGLIPQLVATIEKAQAVTPQAITLSDIACVAAFFGYLVLAILCLTIFGMYWWRNRGLAEIIRNRVRAVLLLLLPAPPA